MRTHQLAALFLTAIQERRTEAGVQGRLHALDEAPTLEDLLLQSTEVVHVTDGVATISVGK